MGLRGAAPIILAIFPLVAGIPKAGMIFNLVFFIVLSSVLIQGSSVGLIAKWLKVEVPLSPRRRHLIEYGHSISESSEMNELFVPFGSPVAGKSVMALGLPSDAMVLIVSREEGTIVPTGRTVIEEGDVLMVLADKKALTRVQDVLTGKQS
jgi:cell volume regulation protein A